jgi:hypothetical protein
MTLQTGPYYFTQFENTYNTSLVDLPIEIGLEHAPFVVLVYFFPRLNMQKPADYGPQQH